jgi:hypothetical protein
MNKKVLTKYINIMTFILWLSILEKVIMDNSANLKLTCILLIVCLMIDTLKDIWDCKEVDNEKN